MIENPTIYKSDYRNKTIWLFYIAFTIVPIFGLFFLIGGEVLAGSFMIGLGALFYFALIFGGMGTGVKYLLSDSSLTLKTRWKTLEITFSEISTCTRLTEKQAEEFIKTHHNQPLHLDHPLDFKKALKHVKKQYSVITFLGTPVVYTRRNHTDYVHSVNISGDVFAITTANGNGFLINPKDRDGFEADLRIKLGNLP